MKKKIPVEKLLRWRFEKAKIKAPPSPTAASLLALAQPWWETSPEQFQLAIRRLSSIRIASAKLSLGRVPVLIVRPAEELETSARILSVSLDEGRMQFSFQLETAAEPDEQMFEATVVSEATSEPLFCTLATKSPDNKYHLSAKLSDDIATDWGRLKATDQIPFRLILRSLTSLT